MYINVIVIITSVLTLFTLITFLVKTLINHKSEKYCDSLLLDDDLLICIDEDGCDIEPFI